MTRAEFAAILRDMSPDGCRQAGQVPPAVCRVCERDDASRRAVDAIIAWEIGTRALNEDGTRGGPETGRVATPADMEEIVAKRLAFEAERAAA